MIEALLIGSCEEITVDRVHFVRTNSTHRLIRAGGRTKHLDHWNNHEHQVGNVTVFKKYATIFHKNKTAPVFDHSYVDWQQVAKI
jgi:hypothetical protein